MKAQFKILNFSDIIKKRSVLFSVSTLIFFLLFIFASAFNNNRPYTELQQSFSLSEFISYECLPINIINEPSCKNEKINNIKKNMEQIINDLDPRLYQKKHVTFIVRGQEVLLTAISTKQNAAHNYKKLFPEIMHKALAQSSSKKAEAIKQNLIANYEKRLKIEKRILKNTKKDTVILDVLLKKQADTLGLKNLLAKHNIHLKPIKLTELKSATENYSTIKIITYSIIFALSLAMLLCLLCELAANLRRKR